MHAHALARHHRHLSRHMVDCVVRYLMVAEVHTRTKHAIAVYANE